MIEKSELENFEIDHQSPIPLHKQVEELLRELIAQPAYQDGKLLPKEIDIAKRLGISRNTVRQASNKLVYEKLLSRKKGVGTKAIRKAVSTKLSNWHSFSQEMHQQGLKFINYEINISRVKATEVIANALEIKKQTQVLKLERLRGLEEGPIVLFISYLHPRIGISDDEDFSKPLYDILEKKYATYPEVSKEQIKAMLADQYIADKLNVEPDSPILHRKRFVYDPGGRPIEYNIGYYLGDKFTYLIDIQR